MLPRHCCGVRAYAADMRALLRLTQGLGTEAGGYLHTSSDEIVGAFTSIPLVVSAVCSRASGGVQEWFSGPSAPTNLV
jgi:hypothetical protein